MRQRILGYVLGYGLSQHWEVRAGMTYLTNWAGGSEGSYGDWEGFQMPVCFLFCPSFTGTNHIIVHMEVDQEMAYTLCYSRIFWLPKGLTQSQISSPKGTKSMLHEKVQAGQVNQNINSFVL